MNNTRKKTSIEWYKKCPYEILDPDGWDRSGDFNYSFNKELITKREFNKRLMQSTLKWKGGE